MTITESPHSGNPSPAPVRRRWKPNTASLLIALLALAGVGILVYPMAASWITSYNQSKLLLDYEQEVADADPSQESSIERARRYNEALQAGVEVEAGANIATGSGVLNDESLVYQDILAANESGLMGHVKIPSINADLPIYHGTSDEVLGKGAGHLEGSHLPVGGESTHSVITAHRGLADAEMFTNLDQVVVGDRFVIEVFGEVLTYEVRGTQVVEPEDTGSLRPNAGLDQVTLITCTPLGINSHRILVTGERILPTPVQDLDSAGPAADIPGFPWWAVFYGGTLIGVGSYLWRSGYADARQQLAKGRPEE